MPKKGGLGQFTDLKWGLDKKEEVVALRGEGVDTPMHTMDCCQILLLILTIGFWMISRRIVNLLKFG